MAACVLVPSPVLAFDLGRFLPLLYLAGALLIGAFVIMLVAKWRRARPTLGPSASDQLAQYRLLYEQGAISEEEYKKLRSLLRKELLETLDVNPVPKPAQPGASDAIPAPNPNDPPPETGIRPS